MGIFESEKDKAARIAKENLAYKIQLQMECKNIYRAKQQHETRRTECYNQIAACKAAGNTEEARKIFKTYSRSQKAIQRYEAALDLVENAITTTELATSQAKLTALVPKLLDNVDLDNLQVNMELTQRQLEEAEMKMESGNSYDLASDAEFAEFYNKIPTGNTSTIENNQGLADLRTQLEQAKRG